MTSRKQCTMYYSLIGKPLDPANFGAFSKSIAEVEVVLEMYCLSHEDAEEDITFPDVELAGKTVLSIQKNITMDMFFTSKTYCSFGTKAGKILSIAGQNCFSISLFRIDDNRDELKVKFMEAELNNLPLWSDEKLAIQ